MSEKKRRVTLAVDGIDVLFRIPTAADVWAVLGALPTLPTAETDQADVGDDDQLVMRRAVQSLAQADDTLMRCALDPKLVQESKAEQPEGEQSLQEIDPEARFDAMAELFRLGGFSDEEVAEVRPLSETAEGS